MERDYNFFQISASYFSQGPGNFRDVAQNRRSDVLFNPATGDLNIRLFLSLIQADGYNPLTVANPMYTINAAVIEEVIIKLYKLMVPNGSNQIDQQEFYCNHLRILLSVPFRLGEFFNALRSFHMTYPIAQRNKIVQYLLSVSTAQQVALYAQNGFWSDHWTYLLDLVESYLSVYPDKEEYLLFQSAKIPFYMSPAIVLPRSKRFQVVLGNNLDPLLASTPEIRMYRAVSTKGDIDFPYQRAVEMDNIYRMPTYVVDSSNAGSLYQRDSNKNTFKVTVYCKLFMLATLKFATMDMNGLGVEMEGGKPGWNDAMNGLPAMIGSGMSGNELFVFQLNSI